MQAMELYDLIHREPFQPLRLFMKDGRTFEIRFPRLAIVSHNYLFLGIPIPSDLDPVLPISEYLEKLPQVEIDRVEALGVAMTSPKP
ncbi:MAG TPA: hypothetical protein DDY78_21705 [Planctomycetales bacterium]|jgi:hypothetical protein|nr:hypothetical protein [Planctomycetales bacterium]